MQIEFIREFLTVADCKSISEAAQNLFLTQPVLSRHIKAIETELGTDLFARSSRGLELTDLGEEVYNSFTNILRSYDSLVDRISAVKKFNTHSIHFGILAMTADRYAIPLAKQFREENPDVRFAFITLKPNDIIDGLVAGRLDVGFVGTNKFQDKGQLTYVKVGKEHLNLAVPLTNKTAKMDFITAEDIGDRPLVCLKMNDTTRVLNNALFNAGFQPRKILSVDELEIVATTVLENNGYFAIPDYMRPLFKMNPSLRVLRIEPPLQFNAYFAYKTSTVNATTKRFIESVEKP